MDKTTLGSLPIQRLRINYPVSKTELVASGRWMGVTRVGGDPPLYGVVFIPSEPTAIGNQAVEANSAVFVDPRCLVRNANSGEVIYDPRDHRDTMDPEMAQYLTEHPNWPAHLLQGKI